MKASEMADEELANWLESIIPDFEGYTSPVSEYFREMAVRLRKPCAKNYKCDSLEEMLSVERRKNADLRSRLKAAEDGLGIARDFTKWTAVHAEDELRQTIRDRAIETEFNMNHPECAVLQEKGEIK